MTSYEWLILALQVLAFAWAFVTALALTDVVIPWVLELLAERWCHK